MGIKRRPVESTLRELSEIGSDPNDTERKLIETSLRSSSSLVAAKATRLAGRHRLKVLAPLLVDAFDRFVTSGAKRDPGCTAKVAIIETLTDLEVDETTLFRRATGHVQMEPVWGGRIDTAAKLRGVGLLALVSAGDSSAPTEAARLLFDPEVETRHLAVAGAAALPGDLAEVMLVMKSHAGDAEPSITADCCSAMFRAIGERAVNSVARFLEHGEMMVVEGAALAIAESRHPDALEILWKAWQADPDSSRRETLILPIALIRTTDATEKVLELTEHANRAYARAAVEALRIHRHDPEISARVAARLTERGDSELETLWSQDEVS